MKTESIPEKAELMNNVDKIVCDNCFEKYLFHLKNLNGEFTVGLTDILKEYTCVTSKQKPEYQEFMKSIRKNLNL